MAETTTTGKHACGNRQTTKRVFKGRKKIVIKQIKINLSIDVVGF